MSLLLTVSQFLGTTHNQLVWRGPVSLLQNSWIFFTLALDKLRQIQNFFDKTFNDFALFPKSMQWLFHYDKYCSSNLQYET